MNASDFLPAEFNVATLVRRPPRGEGAGAAPAVPLRGPHPHLWRRPGARQPHRATPSASSGCRWRIACSCSAWTRRSSWARSGARSRSAPSRFPSTPSCAPRTTSTSSTTAARGWPWSRRPCSPRSGPRSAEAPLPAARAGGGRCRARALSWYEDRVARPRAISARPRRPRATTPAFWLYSSGSTGFPKGAVHLQHDMVVCQETYAKQVLGIRPTDRVFSAAKLFFAYGLGNAGYFPLGVGAQSVLYPHRPTPEAVFERHRPPSAHALLRGPHALRRHAGREGGRAALRPLVAAPVRLGRRGAARGDLPALARALRGGDRRRHRHDGDPAHLPVQPPGRGAAGLVGIARARLRGRASSTTRAARCPAARSATSACAATPPWPTTGTSTTRPRRRSSVRGSRRATSTIRTPTATSGTAAAPTTCSRSAASGSRRSRSRPPWSGIRPCCEAAVVGKEDARSPGQAPGLRGPQGPGAGTAEALAEELQAFVKDKIAPYKYPRWIDFVAELPKTATGKIQRFKLRSTRTAS